MSEGARGQALAPGLKERERHAMAVGRALGTFDSLVRHFASEGSSLEPHLISVRDELHASWAVLFPRVAAREADDASSE